MKKTPLGDTLEFEIFGEAGQGKDGFWLDLCLYGNLDFLYLGWKSNWEKSVLNWKDTLELGMGIEEILEVSLGIFEMGREVMLAKEKARVHTLIFLKLTASLKVILFITINFLRSFWHAHSEHYPL